MSADLPYSAHPPIAPLTEQCIVRSAKSMGVPLDAVKAILRVEGGKVGLAVKNKNGSYDLGPMQINTFWLNYFKKKGITGKQLRYNGCINVLAGAHILSKEIHASHSVVRGMARYHSHTRRHQVRYLRLISVALKRHPSLSGLVHYANKI